MRHASLVSAAILLCATAGTARAQQQPPGPTAEQMLAGLREQWQAFMVASIANAKARGQSPGELGVAIGHLFAPSWPADLTPQRLARAVCADVRLIGLECELLEDAAEQVTYRQTLPDSAQFAARFGDMGGSVGDYWGTLDAIIRTIADERGLAMDEHADGQWIVVAVTRKP